MSNQFVPTPIPPSDKGKSPMRNKKLRNSTTYHILDKEFFQYLGLVRWKSATFPPLYRRDLYFSLESRKTLENHGSEIQAAIANAADYWTEGKRCRRRLNHKTKKYEGIFLKRLHPSNREIWEIKVTDPKKSQTRILGRFIRPNVFLACKIFDRNELEKWKPDSWEIACNKTEAVWNAYGLSAPFRGNRLSDYLGDTDHDDYDI